MTWKRISLALASILLISMGRAGPAYGNEFVGSDRSDGAGSWESLALWQDYAVYLISRHLCGQTADGDDIWPGHTCTTGLAEVVMGPDGMGFDHPSHTFKSPSWETDPFAAGFAFDSSSLLTDAQFELPETYDNQQTRAVGEKPVAVGREEGGSSASIGDDAIPGSLLVTILALVGIVAVARRDISGKDHGATMLVDPRSEVATISSLRHNAGDKRSDSLA